MTLQQALSGNPADKALPDQKHPPASQESRSKQAKQPRTTIWRLVDYLRPFWKNILLASICLLLSSAAGLSFPWIVQNLLDSVFIYHNKELRHIALWLVALFLLKSLFDFVQNYQVLYTGERLIVHMRKQVYEHLQALSLTFFDNWQTGEIMSRITTDVVAIQTGITSSVLNLAQEIMMLIGSVLIIVLIDWHLTLLIALALPPIIVIATIIGRRLRKYSRGVQQELGTVSTTQQETLSSMRVVKLFGREEYEIKRFHHKVETAFVLTMKRARLKALLAPAMNFMAYSTMILVIWYGGVEVHDGHLTPGQLISFIIYLFLLADPVRALSALYAQFQEALGAAERIFELLDIEPERYAPPDDAIQVPPIAGTITFEHVSFRYLADTPVFQDLSLTIQPGQTVAFVGPSGAGKTTLISLVSRLYEPLSGRILVDNYDLRHVDIHSYRDQIAIVPQEPVLFGDTIQENIAYGRLEATQGEIEAAAEAANAAEFIHKLPQKYNTLVGERGVKLSAG
jgi:subfamily B ATP-binding cassette protein MsbA